MNLHAFDEALRVLIRQVENGEIVPQPITLGIHGSIVTGEIASHRAYHAFMNEAVATSLTPSVIVNAIETGFTPMQIPDGVPVEINPDDPFILLRNAVIFHARYNMRFAWWRGRLHSVDHYAMAALSLPLKERP